MRAYDIIFHKREGHKLSAEEIDFFVQGYTQGSIPDYQASAFLMAVFLKGMESEEIVDLVRSFIQSGEELDLSAIQGFKGDKHSTGGVGDKTSLIVAPLVASFGLPMAKMSGRGLGHTGGTVDKLESIPGFKTEMSTEQFFAQVEEIGLAILAQTSNLAPADKKFYALRDVTATIDHPALIASSIMSKKIASGADGIILDVKVGSGAFLKSLREARELAQIMVDIGESMGRKTQALLTNMDEPLGYAVGNSLEVMEALDVLKGQGPQDLRRLSLELSAALLVMGDVFDHHEEAVKACEDHVDRGLALEKFMAWIKAQGATGLDFKESQFRQQVKSLKSGFVSAIDAQKIGEAAGSLGAGRLKKEDSIDPAAGILLAKKVGDEIEVGSVLAELFSDDEASLKRAQDMVLAAYQIQDHEVEALPLIRGHLYRKGEKIIYKGEEDDE